MTLARGGRNRTNAPEHGIPHSGKGLSFNDGVRAPVSNLTGEILDLGSGRKQLPEEARIFI